MIIALAGYAKAGKDTVGKILVEDHGFVQMAFADTLRDMLVALNPLVEVNSPEGPGRTTRPLVNALVEFTWDQLKSQSEDSPWGTRSYLQRLGTDAAREHLGPNVWVDALYAKVVNSSENIVITDLRFANEAKAVVEWSGYTVHIERPGTEPVNAHQSETALDGWKFDGYILNSGTVDELRDVVRQLVEKLS